MKLGASGGNNFAKKIHTPISHVNSYFQFAVRHQIQTSEKFLTPLIYRVYTGPGKSWIFEKVLESPGFGAKVLESPGIWAKVLDFWRKVLDFDLF